MSFFTKYANSHFIYLISDDAKQHEVVRKGELLENPQKSSKDNSEEKSNISTVLCVNTTNKSVVRGQGQDGAIGLVVDWFSSFYFISSKF